MPDLEIALIKFISFNLFIYKNNFKYLDYQIKSNQNLNKYFYILLTKLIPMLFIFNLYL